MTAPISAPIRWAAIWPADWASRAVLATATGAAGRTTPTTRHTWPAPVRTTISWAAVAAPPPPASPATTIGPASRHRTTRARRPPTRMLRPADRLPAATWSCRTLRKSWARASRTWTWRMSSQVVVESVERVPSQERPAHLAGRSRNLTADPQTRIDRSDYPAGFSIQHILRSPRQLYARTRHAPTGRATPIIKAEIPRGWLK